MSSSWYVLVLVIWRYKSRNWNIENGGNGMVFQLYAMKFPFFNIATFSIKKKSQYFTVDLSFQYYVANWIMMLFTKIGRVYVCMVLKMKISVTFKILVMNDYFIYFFIIIYIDKRKKKYIFVFNEKFIIFIFFKFLF